MSNQVRILYPYVVTMHIHFRKREVVYPPKEKFSPFMLKKYEIITSISVPGYNFCLEHSLLPS